MQAKWDTISSHILELTAISGELPYIALNRLRGGSEYKRKAISSLRQSNLLRKITKDGLSGYRLTASAKRILLNRNKTRFEHFLTGKTETNMVKSELTRRLRLHKISDAYIIMQNAKIEIFRDRKTPLFEQLREVSSTAFTAFTAFTDDSSIRYQDIILPAFYDSKEIKAMGATLTNVRGSRLIGALMTEQIFFAVYHTGNTLMRWETGSEIKTRGLLYDTFRRKVTGFDPVNIRGLMIGDSMDIALELLESDGGASRRHSMVDDSYSWLHFLPNDENGELLLGIFCNRDIWESTDAMLKEDFASTTISVCDAMSHEGTPVLFSYTMDLKRIKSFTAWIAAHSKKGIIICFDFQKDVLSSFCGENIKLETLDSNKYRRRFFGN